MDCNHNKDCLRDHACGGWLLKCAYTNVAERLPEVAAALAQRETEE